MTDPKHIVASVRYQLYAGALLRCGLLGGAAYLLTATFAPWLAVVAGLLGLGLGVWLTGLYRDPKPQAIRLIHQTVGDVEYSLSLIDKPQPNMAEQLQLERLAERIRNARMPVVVFRASGLYAGFLLVALLIHVGYPWLRRSTTEPPKQLRTGLLAVADDNPTPPAFRSASLRVVPPAYTGLPERATADLNTSSVVGSALRWQLTFSDSRNLSVRLVSSRGAEVRFRRAGGAFVHEDKLLNSGLYAIKAYWTLAGRDSLVYQSDFYRLDARPDLAPRIEPESKELYRYHTYQDPAAITVAARLSDDFRVTQAFIVATVARGSGENVKFREVRLPLSPANFQQARLTKTLDLAALQFAPGDELYYYWAAFDNRQPMPNFTKSDTYFVVYRDTSNHDEGELATMAVNIMPDYFRSQRQIIIDTEKLLANRKRTPIKTFQSASNEIGFDQKALRLRYGQFLGEEFEKSIGGGDPLPREGEVVGSLDQYMHKHDEGEGDHTAATPAREENDHDHDHGGGGPRDADPLAALMAQYIHSHDDAETNTFHEQSTRALLKTALENMWQSELHLRLYEPEKALPYERKALEFLKLSQQKARSYVRKTGFDPPPIKEAETRLTGELKNVNTRPGQARSYDQPRLNALVAEVLGYLNLPQLSGSQRLRVQQLGNALTDQVINSGLPNWSVLTTLQKLVVGKPITAGQKKQAQATLYSLIEPSLPTASGPTARSARSDHKLEQAFWRHLP